jgi:nucleotide-binding universal stress UspA family protein
MVRFHKILCPVDFSKSSSRAFDYALKLAKTYAGTVHLLYVVEPVVSAGYDVPVAYADVTADLQDAAKGHLRKFQARAEKTGVKVTARVQLGDVDMELLRAVKKEKADLIVMGTHGRRGFERLILGSETERMIRKCPVPLMVVHAHEKHGAAPANIRRILLTTDFSDGARDAAKHALSIAQGSKAKLTVLHVVPDLVVEAGDKDREPLIRAIENEMQKLIPAEALKSVHVDTRVELGLPAEVIPQVLANGKFDLLVMNIHGKNTRERTFIGSTAERTLREVSGLCPVLLIPPKEQAKRKLRAA